MVSPPEKLISFIVAGRNDDYCGNFKQRLQMSMNFLARSAQRAGIIEHIELLLVDWNSDLPLLTELELSDDSIAITRVIQVSAQIAQKYKQHSEQNFHSSMSYNSGVRRASGKYIFIMPADTIVSQSAMQNLYNLLIGQYALPYSLDKTILKISRKMIPYLKNSNFDYELEELDLYLANCSSSFYLSGRANITAGLAAIGTTKAIWMESRCFHEQLGDWGFADAEFGLRMEQLYHGLELSHYGILFYDYDQDIHVKQQVINKSLNPEIYPNRLQVNNKDWGLANEPDVDDYMASDFYSKHLINTQPKTSKPRIMPVFVSVTEILSFQPLANLIQKYNADLIKFFHSIYIRVNPEYVIEFGMTDFSFAEIAVKINNTIDLDYFYDWNLPIESAEKNRCLTPLEIGTKLHKYYRHRGKLEFFNSVIQFNTKMSKLRNKEKSELIIFQFDGMHCDTITRNLNLAISLLSEKGKIILLGESLFSYKLCMKYHEKLNLTSEYIEEKDLKIAVLSKIENLSEIQL